MLSLKITRAAVMQAEETRRLTQLKAENSPLSTRLAEAVLEWALL